MSLRGDWKAKKTQSEDVFKKAHAKELLDVHTQGVTGYPIKFDKDLGPSLDKYESAKKANKAADANSAKTKAGLAITEYRKRINAQKTALGAAAKPLEEGLHYLETKLV